MDENKLLEVCFKLAESLMWASGTTPIEKLPEHIAELNEMTNIFMDIAMKSYYNVSDLPNGNEIMLGAILYLNALAIPPLKGNYSWFFNSLNLLLEICNPTTNMVEKEGIPFLLSLNKGVGLLLEGTIGLNK